MMQKRGIVLGMTGGIACGKSTAASFLEERGWRVIDSDAIAHDLMRPGEKNWKLIVDNFGHSVLKENSEIDRAALAAKVFRNPEDLHRLNQLTHPAICEACFSRIELHRSSHCAEPLVCVVPLLYEIGFTQPWDAVLAVGASVSTQTERLVRRGLDAQGVEDRLASQLPVVEKIKRADYVVWNDGSLEVLHEQLEEFHAQI